MKTKIILISLALITLIAACNQQSPNGSAQRSNVPQRTQIDARVPAFLDAKNLDTLRPTLSPEQFTGITREAYAVAQEMPETLAQLPCYCHCDQSMGHKSLHSCYEDMHAAGCGVCIKEALIAHDLQQSGLTPAQIRERIIAQYSREN
jgi:hypothetical protein